MSSVISKKSKLSKKVSNLNEDSSKLLLMTNKNNESDIKMGSISLINDSIQKELNHL